MPSQQAPSPRPGYFTDEGDHYAPTDHARGWWRPDSLLGRAVVGLVGREIGRAQGEPGLVPARFTIDLHGMPPFAPLRIETRTLRRSGRLKLAEAVMFSGEGEYARATCLFLKPSTPAEIAAPCPPPWQAPHPDTFPNEPGIVDRYSEMRVIRGEMGSAGPRECWMRERQDVIVGETDDAWTMLSSQMDFGSPWAHAGIEAQHINADVTCQVHRLPVGEWIGFEAIGRESSGGIAVGTCRIHDLEGPLGYISTTAIAMKRRD